MTGLTPLKKQRKMVPHKNWHLMSFPAKIHQIPFPRLTCHGGVPYITTMGDSQLARLSRIEGQVRGIKKMIEEERYCVDVLLQLRSAINALCKVQDNIFHHHLETCVHDSLSEGSKSDKEQKIHEILELIDRFRKP